MANEFRHEDVGGNLSQAEWEAIGGHIFNSQAKGDILIASSATQLGRLGITNDRILVSSGSLPVWSATLPSFAIADASYIQLGDTEGQIRLIPGVTAAGWASLELRPSAGDRYMAFLLYPNGTEDRSQISMFNCESPLPTDYSAFTIEVNGDTVYFLYEDVGTPAISIAHFEWRNNQETQSLVSVTDRLYNLGSLTNRYGEIHAEHHLLTQALGGDHRWSGLTAEMTAGTALVRPQAVYVGGDGKMEKALATGAATMPAIALATFTIAENAEGEFLLQGFFRDDTWDWTPGGLLYISKDTAGALTQTAPAGAGEQVQVVGVAITADIIYFNPSFVLVEIS